ncbi:hypothetical protein, partial [uncultured Roseobacter sp.]|uniref:hypothetical protein n=1 Tax=uncultured Roseobacter sp. TaxID=114847 RepID=UPI0026072409
NHRPDGPNANHALTIKLDHSGGADHFSTVPIRFDRHSFQSLFHLAPFYDHSVHIRFFQTAVQPLR